MTVIGAKNYLFNTENKSNRTLKFSSAIEYLNEKALFHVHKRRTYLINSTTMSDSANEGNRPGPQFLQFVAQRFRCTKPTGYHTDSKIVVVLLFKQKA